MRKATKVAWILVILALLSSCEVSVAPTPIPEPSQSPEFPTEMNGISLDNSTWTIWPIGQKQIFLTDNTTFWLTVMDDWTVLEESSDNAGTVRFSDSYNLSMDETLEGIPLIIPMNSNDQEVQIKYCGEIAVFTDPTTRDVWFNCSLMVNPCEIITGTSIYTTAP